MVEKADVGGSEHEKSVVSAGALWSWFITGIPSLSFILERSH